MYAIRSYYGTDSRIRKIQRRTAAGERVVEAAEGTIDVHPECGAGLLETVDVAVNVIDRAEDRRHHVRDDDEVALATRDPGIDPLAYPAFLQCA